MVLHAVCGTRFAVCSSGLGESEQSEGPRVLRTPAVPFQGLPECGLLRISQRKQRHARPEFHVIGRAEHLVRGPASHRIDRRGAGLQALTQHRVLE